MEESTNERISGDNYSAVVHQSIVFVCSFVRSFVRSFVWTFAFSENKATNNVPGRFFFFPRGQQRRVRSKNPSGPLPAPPRDEDDGDIRAVWRFADQTPANQPTSQPTRFPRATVPRAQYESRPMISRNIPGQGRHGYLDRIAVCYLDTNQPTPVSVNRHWKQQADRIGRHKKMRVGKAGTKSRTAFNDGDH